MSQKKRTKEDIQKDIEALEAEMADPSFWQNKEHAQQRVADHQDLKEELAGVGKYDKSNAIVTIFSGAGGDDSEDFSRMLFEMYSKYAETKGFSLYLVHKNENPNGGFRNITFELSGSRAYGILKRESGVHRLVRISPFNANKKRHTSFSMVEVVPQLPEVSDVPIPEDDVEVDYTKSSGPGGQNVNKRETAVRIVHKPTGIAVHVESGRSQAQNKEKAFEILRGKLFTLQEEQRAQEEAGMHVSKTTKVEWGNQIRSYVLHPYQMVKDHRTDVEIRDVQKVLDGELDELLEAEKNL